MVILAPGALDNLTPREPIPGVMPEIRRPLAKFDFCAIGEKFLK